MRYTGGEYDRLPVPHLSCTKGTVPIESPSVRVEVWGEEVKEKDEILKTCMFSQNNTVSHKPFPLRLDDDYQKYYEFNWWWDKARYCTVGDKIREMECYSRKKIGGKYVCLMSPCLSESVVGFGLSTPFFET